MLRREFKSRAKTSAPTRTQFGELTPQRSAGMSRGRKAAPGNKTRSHALLALSVLHAAPIWSNYLNLHTSNLCTRGLLQTFHTLNNFISHNLAVN